MEETKEINALLHLLDDPDEEVYSTVSSRIISFGKQIIPNLEHLWETTPDEETQERIEMLIHRLHLQDLQQDLREWLNESNQDLLTGLFIISRYQYPDLNLNQAHQELEKMKRNIWLELNSFLTSLEQVNVINNILFNYHKLKGNEVNYSRPDEFVFAKVLESKKGNALTNGLLYLVLAQQLDINLQAVNIPRQFILAYIDETGIDYNDESNRPEHIQFFLDGASGQIYSYEDVEIYFKRLNLPLSPGYFKPLSNKQILVLLLKEYAKCFSSEAQQYKRNDLLTLASLLDDTVAPQDDEEEDEL